MSTVPLYIMSCNNKTGGKLNKSDQTKLAELVGKLPKNWADISLEKKITTSFRVRYLPAHLLKLQKKCMLCWTF